MIRNRNSGANNDLSAWEMYDQLDDLYNQFEDTEQVKDDSPIQSVCYPPHP